MNHQDEVHQALISIFQVSSEEALVSTIEALANELGVAAIQGLPVRQFFERVKLNHAEHLVAEWADGNPGFASEMKRAWDALDDQEA